MCVTPKIAGSGLPASGRATLEPGFETNSIYDIILCIAGSFNGRTEDFVRLGG